MKSAETIVIKPSAQGSATVLGSYVHNCQLRLSSNQDLSRTKRNVLLFIALTPALATEPKLVSQYEISELAATHWSSFEKQLDPKTTHETNVISYYLTDFSEKRN